MITNHHLTTTIEALRKFTQDRKEVMEKDLYRDEYVDAFAKERDPNGIEAGQPGAKLDAGKTPVGRGCLHYFPRALKAVAELSAVGARKYSWKGWEKVSDGIHRYTDALARHELAIEDDFGKRDPDTGVLESSAVAWNALARLELILREQEKNAS